MSTTNNGNNLGQTYRKYIHTKSQDTAISVSITINNMESTFLKLSPDVTLHARISRPPIINQKPLLIFLHYWGGSSSTWYKLTSPDSQTSLGTTYPILAVDLRGWGKSAGPTEETGTAYSITAMASDVVIALQQLKQDDSTKDLFNHGFILVGHSMGAKVALATLSTLQESLLRKLRGLVLVAPAPPTTLRLPPDMKEQQKAAYETKESVRWTVENVLANPKSLSEDDIQLVIDDSLSANKLAKEAWPTYGMAEDVSERVRGSLAYISHAGVRVSVLVGGLDIVEPRERVEAEVCRFLEENGVKTSLRVVENVGHLIPLECPEVICKEISLY
ncbi:putative alpha/beta hydrolase [Aspergillus bombycis]|uniref:Putative alpha/beta hydrolase n=1 Tax=Aspergillus bombycis TaxID=109264 RepID=A0A1F8A9E3_9EURO|nr:putative alpha/beta hydrolase [Aspergillus bombycis]OGM48352.1 putative alpha/beta hydrolase [Aspergillus bombycis]